MAKRRKGGPQSSNVEELVARWGAPVDPELLVLALTHRSFANEMGGLPNNERLEFLGDSVLSVVATEDLFRGHPTVPESQLAKMRSAVVSQTPLAQLARDLDLGQYILLGVGEDRTGGREKDSILSDTVEALIGATYLCNGLETTRKTLLTHLRPYLDRADALDSTMDWKTPLREVLQQQGRPELTFEVEGEGPDHNRHYRARAMSGSEFLAQGEGSSRKQAENQAARVAYLALGQQDGEPRLA